MLPLALTCRTATYFQIVFFLISTASRTSLLYENITIFNCRIKALKNLPYYFEKKYIFWHSLEERQINEINWEKILIFKNFQILNRINLTWHKFLQNLLFDKQQKCSVDSLIRFKIAIIILVNLLINFINICIEDFLKIVFY